MLLFFKNLSNTEIIIQNTTSGIGNTKIYCFTCTSVGYFSGMPVYQTDNWKLNIQWISQFYCVDHNKQWKILKELGIPDHLTCLLRNLYASQEATVRTGHGTTDWFLIGKGVRQGCILSPDDLTYMQSTSWEMLDWRKHKQESRLPGEISITSDTQMTPPLWQKVTKN